MPHDVFKFWQREWPVIKQAPVSFFLVVILINAVAWPVSWAIIWYLTSERLEAVNARNDYLSDKNAGLEKELSDTRSEIAALQKIPPAKEKPDAKFIAPLPQADGSYSISVSLVQPFSIYSPTIMISNISQNDIFHRLDSFRASIDRVRIEYSGHGRNDGLLKAKSSRVISMGEKRIDLNMLSDGRLVLYVRVDLSYGLTKKMQHFMLANFVCIADGKSMPLKQCEAEPPSYGAYPR